MVIVREHLVVCQRRIPWFMHAVELGLNRLDICVGVSKKGSESRNLYRVTNPGQ
jgi:hypothetical protein